MASLLWSDDMMPDCSLGVEVGRGVRPRLVVLLSATPSDLLGGLGGALSTRRVCGLGGFTGAGSEIARNDLRLPAVVGLGEWGAAAV